MIWLTKNLVNQILSDIKYLNIAKLSPSPSLAVLWPFPTTHHPPPTTHRNHPSVFKWSHILPQFWPNFKGRVLEPSSTDSNCHVDICLGNICPGDICPYQQYPSCYWPDLDQILNKGFWEQIQQITTVPTTFVQATFVLGTFVHISNISAVTNLILTKH